MPIPPPPPPPPGPPPPPTLSQVGVTSLGGEVACPHTGAARQRNCPWRRLAVAGVGCSGRWECGAGLFLCWGVLGRC